MLLFDAAGRLVTWDAAAAAPPDVAEHLVVGAGREVIAPLLERLGAGKRITERPLADGGSLLFIGPEASPQAGDSDPSGRLYAAASHDLRQPLAALSLLLGALEGRLDSGARRSAPDGALRDLTAAMDNAIQTMREMVDGHFDLIRLEAGLLRPDPGTHVVNGILMRVALDCAPRFAARGLRFSVMPCSACVRTDATLLERILQGLVANTLRHTDRGRVVLGCRRHGDDLRIELWDTGRRPSSQPSSPGHGASPRPVGEAPDLGLRLAEGLARRLGHRLEVCAMDERRALSAVVVPRATEQGSPDAGAEAGAMAKAMDRNQGRPSGGGSGRAANRPQDLSRLHVLVIEDDPMVLDALGALLGQWGCAVTGADSADAAREWLGGNPAGGPDLVIADLRLRGTANGIVAIRQLAKLLGRDLPGLVLTGDTDPVRLREARLSGYLLLHKPVAPLALRVAVIRALGRDCLKS